MAVWPYDPGPHLVSATCLGRYGACQSGFCQTTASIQNNAFFCPSAGKGKCKMNSRCNCQRPEDVVKGTGINKEGEEVACLSCADTRDEGEASARVSAQHAWACCFIMGAPAHACALQPRHAQARAPT